MIGWVQRFCQELTVMAGLIALLGVAVGRPSVGSSSEEDLWLQFSSKPPQQAVCSRDSEGPWNFWGPASEWCSIQQRADREDLEPQGGVDELDTGWKTRVF